MRRILGLITALGLSSGSLAQETAKPAVPDEDITVTGKTICKMETPTGSMMPQRICRTKTQSRDEERAQDRMRSALSDIQQSLDIARMQKCRSNGDVGC